MPLTAWEPLGMFLSLCVPQFPLEDNMGTRMVSLKVNVGLEYCLACSKYLKHSDH